MAETGLGEDSPVFRQAVVEPRAGVECIVGVGWAPRLVAQHCRWIYLVYVRQRCAAQQLIAAAVALHLVLVLEVALKNRLGTELPIGRAGTDCAPAIGVVHVACNSFAGQVDSRANLLV